MALMMFENYQNKSLNELEILGSDTVAKNTLSETEQLLLNVIFPFNEYSNEFLYNHFIWEFVYLQIF